MPRSAALCSPRQARAAPRPPNILFIMADQLAACRLGCYGSGVPSTPVLDGLARAGLRFDRCYATHPVCAPSRASFLTGRSACVHGIIGNNFALAGDLPTYAQVLRDHGYRTAGFGKFHQTPMHRPAPRDAQFLGFTTDHGEMLGDHGLVAKGVMHFDAGIRCPLVVAGGGVTAAGATARLTGTLDFFPTFCDWAGIPAGDRPPLEGRSFAPVCAGAADADPWRELSVSFRSVETVVTDDGWRLTRYTDEGTGHLFDLAADPEEQRNLYTDAGLRDQRGALLERLADAATRPHRTPHYRNLPLIDGRKVPIVADEMLPGLPHYRMPASPEL